MKCLPGVFGIVAQMCLSLDFDVSSLTVKLLLNLKGKTDEPRGIYNLKYNLSQFSREM